MLAKQYRRTNIMTTSSDRLNKAIHELNNQMQCLSFKAALIQEQVGKLSSTDLAKQTEELCASIRIFVELSENVNDLKQVLKKAA